MRKVAVWTGSLLVLLVAFAFLAFHWLGSRGAPRREGTARVAGLSAPVEVRWDGYGVPHMIAAAELDLVTALGYLHANDRLTQMELGRRAVAGRLSEILGEATLELDREARRLRLREASERLWLSAGRESRRWLEAYSAGVNAWLEERGSDLPPTLTLLRVAPEPWSPDDSLAMVLLMGRDLSFWQGRPEEERFRWLGELGFERTRELIGDPVVHRPAGLDQLAASWLQGARRARPPMQVAISGSNNWALGAARAVEGAALVANDPHLGFRLPGHWYQVHLRAPGVEAGGMTIPGVPGIVIGQTADVAWALTNVMLDDQDLFLEELGPDGKSVRRGDGWTPIEVRREALPVRGGAGETLELWTSDVGPMFPADPELGLPLRSLRWTGHLDADPLSAFLTLLRAGSVDEIPEGLAGYVCPAQNLVAVDRYGGLLYTVLGRLPRRRAGDGRLPAFAADPASGWDGLEPRERNPLVLDPGDQLLVTANHDIRPPGYATPLTAEFDLPARAERIRRLLDARPAWQRTELGGVQTDVTSLYALRLVELVEDRYEGSAARAWQALREWDGGMRLHGPAALFVLFEQRLFEAVFSDELDPSAVHAINRRRWLVDLLEGRMSERWFDDVDTRERTETRRQVLQDVLARAWDAGVERWGPDPAGWRYGDLHRLVLRHPLGALPMLGRWMNRGPFPLAGSATTVNALGGPWEGDLRTVTYGPSMRWIAQPGAGNRALAVLPAGQSGHPWDRHYDDQMELYFEGKLRQVPWSEQEIAAATVSVLRLE